MPYNNMTPPPTPGGPAKSLGSQFFKPTGFEVPFNTPAFQQQKHLRPSHKRTLEDAIEHITHERRRHSAVSVSLEPGSGKTTVLPFRFATVPVCVILPTGFDALAAYRLASDKSNIDTSSLKEENGSNVTYMDSYTAGLRLFQHRDNFPFKVVIIDESDSSAGITKTLTEICFKSAFVIHLSGTPEGREIVSATGFDVEVSDTLPELSDVYFEAVDFIKERCRSGRGLVMVPSAAVAKQIHSMIKNSRKVDSDMSVEELDSLISDQSNDEIIVADDSCARGFNLNLDTVFDFQLVSAGEGTRVITNHEQCQRRMRVGRTKPGKYYYTRRSLSASAFSKWDVFRNNVARIVFGLQVQPCDLQVDISRLKDLMTSKIEPYELQLSLPTLVKPTHNRSSSAVSVKSTGSRRSSVSVTEKMPAWMLWASGYKGSTKRGSRGSIDSGSSVPSSGSSGSVEPGQSASMVGSPPPSRRSGNHLSKPSTVMTVPSHSSFTPRDSSKRRVPSVGRGSDTPTIDLGTGEMFEWPDALRSAYNSGDPLCFVKPGPWMYTRSGSGVDYMVNLVAIIREGPVFSHTEMEIVCRAWNVMVSRMNFAFAQGKDAWLDNEKVSFVLDYFTSYNNMHLS